MLKLQNFWTMFFQSLVYHEEVLWNYLYILGLGPGVNMGSLWALSIWYSRNFWKTVLYSPLPFPTTYLHNYFNLHVCLSLRPVGVPSRFCVSSHSDAQKFFPARQRFWVLRTNTHTCFSIFLTWKVSDLAIHCQIMFTYCS